MARHNSHAVYDLTGTVQWVGSYDRAWAWLDAYRASLTPAQHATGHAADWYVAEYRPTPVDLDARAASWPADYR